MGLLASVGRRVDGAVQAGDAERQGRHDPRRPILGFLRRICKLLFLRARPVFVFDGATPALKRRTLASRRRHRYAVQAKVRKTAERLLISHVKPPAASSGSELLRMEG